MFEKYKFQDFIYKGLDSIGFKEPTEIQDIVIKKCLKGESVIAKSQTGTGKTHAFLLPILNMVDDEKSVQATIIVPTRELGMQIYDEALKIAKFRSEPLDVRLFVGGTNRDSEIEKLKKSQPQIVIATIGKLKDLAVDENVLKVYSSKITVIDEADMIFEISELEEVDKVFSLFEKNQLMVFSATISKDLSHFLNKYLFNMEVIDLVGKNLAKKSIEHVFIPTKNKNKDELLLELINTFHPYLALIFANTKVKVNEIAEYLSNNNIKVAKITGDLEPRERKQIIKRIKDGVYQYVVASDIASRGIDIIGVSHVINYELPNDIEFYIHRIGRTARFASTGIAISFYDYDDDNYLDELHKKGFDYVYKNLKNGELVVTKERNAVRQKRTSKEEQELHIKYPLAKKVKPGYKKKRNEMIKKESRKLKKAKINEIYRRKAKVDENR